MIAVKLAGLQMIINKKFWLKNECKAIFAVPKNEHIRINCSLRGAIEEEGSVVQLVRMPPCHGGGRGFESRPVRISSG